MRTLQRARRGLGTALLLAAGLLPACHKAPPEEVETTAAVPVEVVEASMPIVFARKELRRGSGGAGRMPGGDGQRVVFAMRTPHPWLLNAVTSRTDAGHSRYRPKAAANWAHAAATNAFVIGSSSWTFSSPSTSGRGVAT